ncbi:hypothetical protein M407DRAFT_28344 [Tulasnella calospora MUT 4182]|uniref:Uncharacterized protein n=1 Tax=Tulasnella calospora MUT 4182 TaxID=1051891 RepID=A0A0C3KL32_9AGAM|nr:hypothetical protein M407DRAFT_28344 [Tulasnella calospora MUT 4182]
MDATEIQDDAGQAVHAAAGGYGGVLDSSSLADGSVNAQVGGTADFYSVPSVDSVGVVDNASLYALDGSGLGAAEGSPSGFLATMGHALIIQTLPRALNTKEKAQAILRQAHLGINDRCRDSPQA